MQACALILTIVLLEARSQYFGGCISAVIEFDEDSFTQNFIRPLISISLGTAFGCNVYSELRLGTFRYQTMKLAVR